MPKSNHHVGENIKMFRKMRDLKQESLARKMGPGWTQEKISELERQADVTPDKLALVASALNLPVAMLRYFGDPEFTDYAWNVWTPA